MAENVSFVANEGDIRVVWAEMKDYLRVSEVLLSLDNLERRNRFWGTVADSVVRQHARLAVVKNAVRLAMCGELPVGTSELACTDDGEMVALSFAVRRGWCNNGIASLLVQKAIEDAREFGYRMVIAESLTSNSGPRIIFLKFGFNYDVDEGMYTWNLHIR